MKSIVEFSTDVTSSTRRKKQAVAYYVIHKVLEIASRTYMESR
jgi:hypothetical protein